MSLNNSLITKLRTSSLTVLLMNSYVCEVGEYIDERYGQVTCVVARDESSPSQHWRVYRQYPALFVTLNKKLRCRRETARYLVLLNISQLIGGHSRSFEMVPFQSLGMAFCSHSMVTMALFLYNFRDKARYWFTIAIFHTSLHSTPPPRLRASSGILPYRLVWKTRMVWLHDSEKVWWYV